MKARTCIYCGCTDTNACMIPGEGPCSWVSLHPPVCSAPACLRKYNTGGAEHARRDHQLRGNR